MVALFRPGPMDNIRLTFAEKINPNQSNIRIRFSRNFSRETHGIAVYQEQVQQIAQSFAGFTLGEGYMMIKAVAKKIPALLEKQREKFIDRRGEKRAHEKRSGETFRGDRAICGIRIQ